MWVSDRVRLAQLSRDAALAVIGVDGADRGPTGLFLTAGDGQQVDGVRCVASGDGGYEVSLRLRCELVPLLAVADGVRTSVRRAASAAGIALADVNVLIADVVDPERS